MSDVYRNVSFKVIGDAFVKTYYPIMSSDDVKSFNVGDQVLVEYCKNTVINGKILLIYDVGIILQLADDHRQAISFSRIIDIHLVKRKEPEYERGMNVTVRDLKECLKDLPDDMEVIVPVFDDIDNNKISGFRHVRAIGVLETPVEPNQALCIATAVGGADMYTLTNMNNLGVKCTKGLF